MARVPDFLARVPNFLAYVPDFLARVPSFLARVPSFLACVPNFLACVPDFLARVPDFLARGSNFLARESDFFTRVPGFLARESISQAREPRWKARERPPALRHRIRAVPRNDALIASIRAQVRKSSPFRNLIERVGTRRTEITGASVEARALLLATLQETRKQRIAVIVPGDASIDDFHNALQLFAVDAQCVSVYPSPALSPYQDVGPSLGVTREEIRALGMLLDLTADILIVPVRALFARLPRPEEFRGRILHLSEGKELDTRELLQTLVENGFVRTDLVGESGEFAFRGGILDLFPPNTPRPVRVELFGDTIESLRWFEVETQRSDDASGVVTVFPMTQFPV
ncbi:MAG: trcF, partial [Acidobacteria bacterium]|nr:trcF [Acidobacteriota bacterium]